MKFVRLAILTAAFSLFGISLWAISDTPAAQETHPTTPGLTSAEINISLSVEEAMKRAHDALLAAGLTLHKPLPTTAGASNETVFALINAEHRNNTTRVIVTVAANHLKRGASHSVCMFLIDFMKTGKAPEASPFNNYAGEWDWKWQGYVGDGAAKVTLKPDGKVASEGWPPNTEWWSPEAGKVCVWFPSAFPKTNLHYVTQFTVSSDGKTMTAGSNYYYKAVTATRIGDAPQPATGGTTPPTGGTGSQPAGGADPLGISLENQLLDLSAPKLPPAPLPMPPVGERANKSAAHTDPLELFAWAAGADYVGQRPEVSLVSLKAVHVPDKNGPDTYDGLLQAEVTLSDVGPNYAVHIYVGGYLAAPKEGSGGGARREGVGGVSYDGHVPGYKWAMLMSSTDPYSPKPGILRRYSFYMPKVLPASVRAELYEVLPRGGLRFVEQLTTTFIMPFKDHKLSRGVVVDKAANKITRVAALLDGATEFLFRIPRGNNPKDASQDIRLRSTDEDKDGKTESKYDIPLTGAERWKEVVVDVWPVFRDTDHRNNHYWPNLPNGGYFDGKPVWVDGFD